MKALIEPKEPEVFSLTVSPAIVQLNAGEIATAMLVTSVNYPKFTFSKTSGVDWVTLSGNVITIAPPYDTYGTEACTFSATTPSGIRSNTTLIVELTEPEPEADE